MYNTILKILKTANMKPVINGYTLAHMILHSDVIKIHYLDYHKLIDFTNATYIGLNARWTAFSNLITTNYSPDHDRRYLRVFRISDPRKDDILYAVFVHWLCQKHRFDALSLLDSPESAGIVSIIIKCIKYDDTKYFNDILEPLWRHFVCQRLFHKLSQCQQHKNDQAFLMQHNYLNQVTAAYFSSFCSDPEFTQFFEHIAEENELIKPQTVFFTIISSQNCFSYKQRKVYFDLFFYDQRMHLINHAWHDHLHPYTYGERQNDEIIQSYLCSLVDEKLENSTTVIIQILEGALRKDKMIIFHSMKSMDRCPIYGLYLTKSVIKGLLFKAAGCLQQPIFDQFVLDILDLCGMFDRADLMDPPEPVT